MKKIKLITPILGAAIATSLIPLTSCNKNSGKQEEKGMSKEQWNKAFASIKDPWDTSRNFSVDGYLYSLDTQGKETKSEEWTCKSVGKFNEGLQTVISTEGTRNDPYDSCLIDDIIWIKDNTTTISPYIGIASRAGMMIASFICFGEIFDSMFEYKTFKGDNKYEAIWLNNENLKGTCDLEFDNDLRIKTVEAKLYYVDETKTEYLAIGAKLNFSQYGTTTTKLKESDFPVADRIKKAKLATTGDKFVVDSFTPDVNNIYISKFDMPSDLSITGLNTIKINDNTADEYEVWLNGKLLVQDQDYKVLSTKTFILNNPLTKSDKLWFVLIFDNNVATTMDLVKE